MGNINYPAQEIKEQNTSPDGGEMFNNVKRLRSGDGSWRFEKGALIISDENGVDRVLIGFLKDGF